MFEELADYRAFELLRSHSARSDYLLTKQVRVGWDAQAKRMLDVRCVAWCALLSIDKHHVPAVWWHNTKWKFENLSASASVHSFVSCFCCCFCFFQNISKNQIPKTLKMFHVAREKYFP